MDKISAELAAAMTDLRDTDGTWQAMFCLPPDFIGFAGHFPGRPIVPAVAQIQMACVVLAASKKSDCGAGPCHTGHPARVDNAKFTRPIGPGEAVTVTVAPTGASRWKALARVNGEKAAEFTLTLKDTA